MGAGKHKSHRKKRISKHVLQAEERRRQKEVEERLLSTAAEGKKKEGGVAVAGDGPSAAQDGAAREATKKGGDAEKSTAQSPKPSSRTKDPDEAAAYLAAWSADKANNTQQWKFNKNAQSWLLRHMYDFDKMSKATFAILVDYLGSGGEGVRSRVEEEAKRRARRYKGWEKRQKPSEEEGDGGDEDDDDEKEQSSDEKAWREMDDHDKRKEYKRARKVLDALKAVREETGDGQ